MVVQRHCAHQCVSRCIVTALNHPWNCEATGSLDGLRCWTQDRERGIDSVRSGCANECRGPARWRDVSLAPHAGHWRQGQFFEMFGVWMQCDSISVAIWPGHGLGPTSPTASRSLCLERGKGTAQLKSESEPAICPSFRGQFPNQGFGNRTSR